MSDLAMALQQRATQISYATEILLEKTRDWQMIREYLCNRLRDTKLTETQQMKMKRYEFIYNQLVSAKYTDQEVLSQVMNLFDVGLPQAYEDLNCSREVFNSAISINKKFEIKMELQSAKDMKRKCVELCDFKAAAAIQKNIIALTAMLPDLEEYPATQFAGHEIEAVFNPELLGAPPVDMKEVLAAINAKRKVKIKTELFETLDFDDYGSNKEATSL